MNRPCLITFHVDTGPLIDSLPERYQRAIVEDDGNGGVHSLSVLHAFYVDFAPDILRTRVGGDPNEDPVDFHISSVSFIEWFYDKVAKR